ncbi:MAG TPA: hypothetical protein VGS23_06910 [Thermoplasmata archaeon]|nr:hypothetical protein [Thermoplasmata archaeon]
MNPWWRKPQPVNTEIVEQITAVEIPVISEVNRRLAKGDYEGAIRIAYPKAARDLARAFRVPFPAGMTHEEFLRTQTTEAMGHLPEFFQRFYELYAPLRYGPPGAWQDPAALVTILKSIYAPRPMWQLYLQPKDPDHPRGKGAPAAEPPASEPQP